MKRTRIINEKNFNFPKFVQHDRRGFLTTSMTDMPHLVEARMLYYGDPPALALRRHPPVRKDRQWDRLLQPNSASEKESWITQVSFYLRWILLLLR